MMQQYDGATALNTASYKGNLAVLIPLKCKDDRDCHHNSEVDNNKIDHNVK